MYIRDEMKEFKNTTIGEIIDALSKFDRSTPMVLNGDNYFYLHADKGSDDQFTINLDDSSLDDAYEDEEKNVVYDGRIHFTNMSNDAANLLKTTLKAISDDYNDFDIFVDITEREGD